ncbi:autophagy-related protein 2 homolog B isoform X2 [Condylostylus longicornis]|uniref:autophagy-related protein 2 homolog B isoform X2 n=1 Tax=Condylostylus longicornis TaxID=2530218 RepID=UPI00244E48E5|nr:autophagy-related protein 2 homolog B isoform X2 [Condylostylus longicornis]
MSWLSPFAGLEKKICRYLLQRYLGQFLEEKLNLDQLNIDLYQGKGTVKDVALNCEALNEVCENQGWGVEVTGGHVGSVAITVPWSAPMTEDSSIEVCDLSISLRPVFRPNDGSLMLESMWSSMSSSMQLAQECLRKESDESIFSAQTASIEGLEKFAQTIDSVLNRIKAKFYNTEIRFEYQLPGQQNGIAIIIKVDHLDYQNEAGNDPLEITTEDIDSDYTEKQKTHLLSTYATHHISIDGITFYTEEFRIGSVGETETSNPGSANLNSSFLSSQQFYSVMSDLPQTAIQNSRTISTPTEKADESVTEENYSENESVCYSNKKIQFAHFVGKQDIRIKMKQSEAISGPKVSLEFQFNLVNVFLSPRQLHLLLAYYEICFKNKDYLMEKKDCVNVKETKDSEKLRKRQQNRVSSNMSGNIGNMGGWSFDPIQDDLFSFSGDLPKYSSSIKSDHISESKSNFCSFEYAESVNSSMTTSTSTSFSSKYHRKSAHLYDSNGSISTFNIRIASMTAIFLHEDILLENSTQIGFPPLSEDSVSQLEDLSNFYFKSMMEQNVDNFKCNKNYLKVMCSPVILDGEQQRNNSNNILKLKCSLTKVDILEILDNERSPLVEFLRDEICSDGFHKRPEITLYLKSQAPTVQNNKGKKATLKTNLNLNLESCVVDFDISIIDRLSAIFNGTPFKIDYKNNESKKREESGISPNKQKQPTFELNLDSPKLNFRLRFPIVDSRPLHDPNRTPWWKKNIRPDFLLFDFLQFRLKNTSTLIEVCSNEVNFYYCESTNGEKMHVGKSTLLNNSCDEIEYPKISIEFPSDKSLKSSLKRTIDDSDSGETSGESCKYYSRKNREPLPFSSKRVCRQSDTVHQKNDYEDTETILLPGETVEMRNFCEKAMKTSKLQFKVFLPIASVQIHSKMLYELIYNRLNSDLLMWEPTAPGRKKSSKAKEKLTKPTTHNNIDQMLWSCGMSESLYIPSTPETNEYQDKSDNDIIDDTNSSSTNNESECESNSVYYSTYENKNRSSKRVEKIPSLALSECSFELIAKEAQCTFFTPVRDSENRVIPGQSGEFVVNVGDFNLFSVSGFNGNENLAYLCIQSNAVKLYHCGLTPTLNGEPILRLIKTALPAHLLPTFYPTPNNSTLSTSKGVDTREMVSFAIEIKKVPQNRIKRLRITAGIQNTTLKYNPAASQHTWLNQLIDLFDVVDYPIQGYTPYHVVTEIQLHLWDCAIDYRPLHFPYRAIVEIGNFMLSSNIISSVPGCTLRFIAEDCVLSLAHYDVKQHHNISKHGIPFVNSKNLIPVLDVGLVDISLRLNDKNSDLLPKLDLRASIQDLHLRTCSDSGKVFAQLIAYIASDGDLGNEENNSEETNSTSNENSADLLSVEEPLPTNLEISAKQQERVSALMAEALQETVFPKKGSKDDDKIKTEKGVELFFFPDETNQHVLKDKENLLQGQEKSSNEIEPEKILAEDERKSTTENYSTVSRSSSEEWRFNKPRRESESSNELRDLLNFETSVMSMSYMADDEVVEALPQIREELGEIPCKVSTKDISSHSRKSSISLDDDFYFVAEEEKALLTKCGHENVKVSSDPLRIVDNHFTLPTGKPDLLKAPEGFPVAQIRYTLCEMTVTWHLYGGHDFPTKEETNNDVLKNKENLPRKYEMSEAYKMGVSFSKGHQSVQFGSKKPISKLSWKTKGGPERKQDVLVEIQLTKVRLSHEIYPKTTSQASRQVLIISEMEIRDRLQTSEINKFLYHPTAKNLSNKSSQHMIVIKALHVRPNPYKSNTQECSLRISLLPLRLNIDQDTLLFLVQFFNELSSNESDADDSSNLKKNANQLQEPVMMVDDIPEALHDLQARKLVSTNLELLMEEDHHKNLSKEHETTSSNEHSNENKVEDSVPIYFREIVFSPEVLIRLDYHGRRIEMSRGPVAGLLMGLGQLQCSEIRLKKIVYRHGLLGADKLLNYLFKEWLQDIKKNQLPTILSGVGPMYTLVQLFQGIRDLFWLPIEQYQKDGRIVRGIQLGAQSFTARTALAALEITSRIIHLLQITAETAFDLVSPGPSVRRGRHNRKGKRKRPHRPQDIREGVANAYQIVKEGINETAQTLIENTVAEHDQKGYTGAVGAVFRQIPPIMVCPVVLATQATTNVLGGVKNQLVPDARLEAKEKWKEDTD